jgi:hypothetical protein
MNTKSFVYSKTFWIAILQVVVGVVVVLEGQYPNVGELLMVKSILDIILRGLTTERITL